jgi:ribosomal protein S18 acetylase RimI-like enzyme
MNDSKEPIITLATINDVVNVRTCARAAYAKYVERIGQEPAPMIADFAQAITSGHVVILANDTEFFGYAVFYPREDHLHLENIAVHPNSQGSGMGARLLQYVEDEARRRGLVAVELYTNERMTENLLLYPRIGYRETSRQTEDGFSRVYFRKEISAV